MCSGQGRKILHLFASLGVDGTANASSWSTKKPQSELGEQILEISRRPSSWSMPGPRKGRSPLRAQTRLVTPNNKADLSRMFLKVLGQRCLVGKVVLLLGEG